MSIALYYSPGACSLAAHVVLQEIGASFVLHRVATGEGAHRQAAFLAVNPKGRLPALQIDGFTLTEAPAILAYLGRRFPDAGLYPAGAAEPEARCLELLAWSSNTVHVAYAQLMRPQRFLRQGDDPAAVQRSGAVSFRSCLEDIERRLHAHRYALIGGFSVVDPFWLVFYRWGLRAGLNMGQDFPAYTAHARQLGERPSVVRALATEQISIWG